MSGLSLKFLNGLIGQTLALVRTYVSGTENTPARQGYNFLGAGVTVADNSGLNAKDVTIPGISGALDSTNPANIAAAAAPGTSSIVAHRDHVHAHGAQTDPTMHALAVAGGNAGFLSGTFATLLTNATSSATASTLCERGASAECAFGALTADSLTITATGAGLSSGAGVAGHGTPVTLKGSTNATPGNPGGAFGIVASPGGTPGTDASGGVYIDVGQAVSGTSQRLSIQQNTTEFLGINLDASAGTLLSASGDFVVLAPTSHSLQLANNTASFSVSTILSGATPFCAQWQTPQFMVLDYYTGGPFIEYHNLTAGAGTRVVSLCRNAAITTTHMPAGSGDAVINVARCITEPTVGPQNGVTLYVAQSADVLRTLGPDGLKTELSYYVQSGGLSRTTLNHFRRTRTVNYAAIGTSGTLLQIPASDWPIASGTKKFTATITWEIHGYDHTNDTTYQGSFKTKTQGINGANVSIGAGGTTAVGTADDGTGGVNPSFTVSRDGSDNVNITVTTAKADSIDWTIWADVKITSSG